METTEDLEDVLAILNSAEPPKANKPARFTAPLEDDGDDPEAFLGVSGIKAEREVPDITKPWMKHHEFVLVRTPEEVEAIVDEALACGRCSLDLETEGLDNRINFDAVGNPRTVHQIVGFCIAVGDAHKGYYIPVRHNPSDGGPDLNVKPTERVEAAITRLCRAAQPTPAPGQSDPLGFRNHENPPKVIIDFWNAKFDQEFLYPVTGIDYWHPESFEDGLLAYFTLYSGDLHLGLKGKAFEVLRDPQGNPYEMIELKELFPNRRKINFPSLSPDEPGVVKYAGSDAICTRLLCARPDLLPVIAKDSGKSFSYRLEKQVTQVVRVMERNRVKVDRSKLTELRDRHRLAREEARNKIIALAKQKGFEDFEPGSPKQLSDFLFGERGLNINPKPPMNEKSGQYKTDYDSLHALMEELGEHAPDVFKWVMEYREEDKVLGTYLESLSKNPDENDELRFQFKQTGAATARFSAPAGDNDQGFSGIPIHGIPGASDIRTSFVAREGYTMVKCDYAGQELRIVTNLSNEPVWIKEFLEGDGDLHSITARAFFGKPEVTKEERKMGKCVHPDTLVSVEGRLMPIRGLTFPKKPDTFRNAKGNVWDGHAWQDLVATYNGGLKPLVHVVTTNGIVTTSQNHLFRDAKGAFLRAQDLTVGVELRETSPAPFEDRPYERPDHSHALAYMTGLMAGSLKEEQREHVRAPHWVMGAGRTATIHYLSGLFDIDSFKAPEGHLTWKTGNFVWAGQVCGLLTACGLDFQVSLPQDRTYVEVWLGNTAIEAFGAYFQSPFKAELKTGPSVRLPNRVVAVLYAGEDLCCDITVGESHVYVANGLVTHNTANFALVYGGGPAAIQRATGCNKLEAQRRKQAFDKALPVFAKWVKGQHEKVKHDLGVRNAFGRWLAIPDAAIQKGQKTAAGKLVADEEEARGIRAACERHATNWPIQGCLQPQSVVLTNQGYKAIGQLAQQGTQGLHVWTGTKWATFTARNMGPCQLADVQLSDGTRIECDTRHKLLVVREDGYHWVEYPDLQVGDCVATSLCHPVDFVPPKPLHAPEVQIKARNHITLEEEGEFWYWMGRYMGDGWIDHDRGLLTYAFGRHETVSIERAISFWSKVGTNPVAKLTEKTMPSGKLGYAIKLDIWSVELTRWLHTLGFVPSDAHTKRLPSRLLSETLENRKAFMRGFMDSDGHKPPVVTAKGNPYNLHLCQQELLEDTKLLLRTLGVESCLRGPYYYEGKKGRVTTSYRLDIQRRMFERHVLGRNDVRHAKFNDMFAPKFLVQNFLSKGTWIAGSFKGDQSLYNLYLRVKSGGKVSLYTLERLCQCLGVTLDHPLYGFKRLTSKVARPEVTDTFTLSVHDPMQRFDAQGVITKNTGADIMKIAMVLLHKEFYRRGWLKHQGDVVRVLLTVHDELVFEIRHEAVFEAIPIITEQMELPTKMAQPPWSPSWKVPLVTDPLVGESWGAEYSCHRAKPGEELKDGAFLAYGYVYKKIPEALLPYRPTFEAKVEPGNQDTPTVEVAAQEDIEIVGQDEGETLTLEVEHEEPLPTSAPGQKVVVTLRIRMTTPKTVSDVRGAAAMHFSRHGAYLRLLDAFGNVLIDPTMGVRVSPKEFAEALVSVNLSDGFYVEEPLL